MKFTNSQIKIMTAFSNLIINYDLSQITTRMIIEDAGITKGTFYKYFKNITEIIIFMENYIDDDINLKLRDVKTKNNPIEAFTSNVLPLIYEKRELIKIMYSKNLNGIWRQFLEKQYKDWAFNLLFKDYDVAKHGITKTVACRFFIHNFLFLLEMWITQPIPQKPEAAKEMFLKLLNTPLSSLYNN